MLTFWGPGAIHADEADDSNLAAARQTVADLQAAEESVSALQAEVSASSAEVARLKEAEALAARTYEESVAVSETLLRQSVLAVDERQRRSQLRASKRAERDAARYQADWSSAKTALATAELALTWKRKDLSREEARLAALRPAAAQASALLAAHAESEVQGLLEAQRRERAARQAELDRELQETLARQAAKLQAAYGETSASAPVVESSAAVATRSPAPAPMPGSSSATTPDDRAGDERESRRRAEAAAAAKLAAEVRRAAAEESAGAAAARAAEENAAAREREVAAANAAEAERRAAEQAARAARAEEQAAARAALREQRSVLHRAAAADRLLSRLERNLAKSEDAAARAREAGDQDAQHRAAAAVAADRAAFAAALAERSELTAAAQEIWSEGRARKWQISIGAGYRSFDEVQFGGVELRNFGSQSIGTPVYDQASANEANGPYGLQHVSSPANALLRVPPAGPAGGLSFEGQTFTPNSDAGDDIAIALDYARFEGSSDSLDADAGAFIGAERTIWTGNDWQLGLQSQLQYYAPSQTHTHRGTVAAPGRFTAAQYLHTFVDTDDDAFGTVNVVINPSSTETAVTEDNTEFAVANATDLALFAMDFGLRATYRSQRWLLSFGGGPTVSLWSLDSRQTQSAVWGKIASSNLTAAPYAAAPIQIDAGSYQETQSDSASGVQLGGYVSGGIAYELTPRLAFGADLRYDIGGTISTDQASMALDGASLQLRLSRRF